MSDDACRPELVNLKEDADAKPSRLLISSSRKPVSYVNLAKRCLLEHDEVQLSALGVAISSMVTLAEILKNKGLAVEKKVTTSLEEISSNCRTRHKPKMSVTLIKSPQFDDILSAESAGNENRDGGSNSNMSRGSDANATAGMHVGPRQYVGGPAPGRRHGPTAAKGEPGGDPHGLRGGNGLGNNDNMKRGQSHSALGNNNNPNQLQFQHDSYRNQSVARHPPRHGSSSASFPRPGHHDMLLDHVTRLQQQQHVQQPAPPFAAASLSAPFSGGTGSTNSQSFGSFAPNEFPTLEPSPLQQSPTGRQFGFAGIASAMQQQLQLQHQQIQQLQERLAVEQQLRRGADSRQSDNITQRHLSDSTPWLPHDMTQHAMSHLQKQQQQQEVLGHRQQADMLPEQFADLGLNASVMQQHGSGIHGGDGTDRHH